jgi:hypothetical protein
MAQQSNSKYVKTVPPKELNDVLYARHSGPIFKIKVVAGYVFLITVIGAMVVPFLNPIRQAVGLYIYVHILAVIGILIWLFIYVLPPPSKATESRRRRFLERANNEQLIHAGLDCSGISATRIASDSQTLEIVVTDEWLKRPFEIRLRDTQNFWWLWTTVYLPYDGSDKVFVRVLDSTGNEVAGSSPEKGSLIWAK